MIFATGYDHNFLAEQKHPDKTVLDEVSKTGQSTFPTPPVYGSCQFGAAKACRNYDRNQRPGRRKIRQG